MAGLLALPETAWRRIVAGLEAADIERLGQTCKALRDRTREDAVWQPLCIDIFGVSLDMQQRLLDDGLPLPSTVPTSAWRAYYRDRHTLLQNIDDASVNSMYASVQGQLERRNEFSSAELAVHAETLLAILDVQPDYAPAFYTLAYVCYIADALSTAQHALEVALSLEPAMIQAQSLLVDVESQLAALALRQTTLGASAAPAPPSAAAAGANDDGAEKQPQQEDDADKPQEEDDEGDEGDDDGDEEMEQEDDDDEDEDEDDEEEEEAASTMDVDKAVPPAPLLHGTQPSEQLRAAIRLVFRRFDRDGDGALNRDELVALITAVNGVAPSPDGVKGMLRNLRSSPRGLLVEGLIEFFRRQSVADPEETRADLAKLGFTPALELRGPL